MDEFGVETFITLMPLNLDPDLYHAIKRCPTVKHLDQETFKKILYKRDTIPSLIFIVILENLVDLLPLPDGVMIYYSECDSDPEFIFLLKCDNHEAASSLEDHLEMIGHSAKFSDFFKAIRYLVGDNSFYRTMTQSLKPEIHELLVWQSVRCPADNRYAYMTIYPVDFLESLQLYGEAGLEEMKELTNQNLDEIFGDISPKEMVISESDEEIRNVMQLITNNFLGRRGPSSQRTP